MIAGRYCSGRGGEGRGGEGKGGERVYMRLASGAVS